MLLKRQTVIVCSIFAMLASLSPSLADSINTSPAALTASHGGVHSWGYSTKTWMSPYVYSFGQDILRYDPATNTTRTQSARLLNPAGAAASNGTVTYLFGGEGIQGGHKRIQRYDPATDSISVAATEFPIGREHMSAKWVAPNFYAWGGVTSLGWSPDVFRFNPQTQALTLMSSRMSQGEAVTDGRYIYMFGGSSYTRFDPVADLVTSFPLSRNIDPGSAVVWLDPYIYIFDAAGIFRFSPTSGSLEQMGSTLPGWKEFSEGISDGRYLYVIGGRRAYNNGHSKQIVRFDPVEDAVRIMNQTLPYPTTSMSAATDGRLAFAFGGRGCTGFSYCSSRTDSIISFDPTSGDVLSRTSLPEPRSWSTAVWSGQTFLVFGGRDCGQEFACTNLDDVLEFDPSTNLVTRRLARMPSGRSGSGSFWHGSYAYVIGGRSCPTSTERECTDSDQVLRYDPIQDSFTVVATLPTARSGAAVVFDGQKAWIIGGLRSSDCQAFSEVLIFDPATGSVTQSGVTIPNSAFSGGVWSGKDIFLFGGSPGCITSTQPVSTITRIDPTAPAASTMTSSLTITSTASVWVGGRGVLFGGSPIGHFNDHPSDAIRTYTLEPGAPSGPSATAGNGQISLAWAPPRTDSHVNPIQGYRVYRGTSSGNLTFIAELGPASRGYVDSGLPKGANRYYAIVAFNSDGVGPRSQEVSARTFSNPGAPTNIQANFAQPGRVTLTWGAPSNNGGTPLTSYRIYRSTLTTGYQLLAEISPSLLTFTDSGCTPGICRYYVTAKNIVGEGSPSGIVDAVGTSIPQV